MRPEIEDYLKKKGALGEPSALPVEPTAAPVDDVDAAARAYLKQRLAAKAAAPQYDGPVMGAGEARGLDAISGAGANISNLFLARAGLTPQAHGTNFAGGITPPPKPDNSRDDIALGIMKHEVDPANAAYKARSLDLQQKGLDFKDKQLGVMDENSDAALREKMQARLAKKAGIPGAKSKADLKAAATGFKNSMDLRKEYDGLKEVQQFKEVSTAYDKIQRSMADPSAAGDLALIIGYNKVLDPGSTVRESEFANAANAGSLDEKVTAAFKKIASGERLTQAQRADFVNQAAHLYEAQKANYGAATSRYRSLAEKSGISPDDVAMELAKPGAKAAAPAAAGALVTLVNADGDEIDVAPAKVEALKAKGYHVR